MKVALFCLAALVARASLAEDAAGRGAINRRDPASMAGVDVEDSPVSKIKWVHARTVDVNKAFGDEPQATQKTRAEAPAPRVGFDDFRKLGDPIPTGVRFQGDAGSRPFEGLMQSQTDPSGNVARITIPGDPPTVINNPRKADGSPLRPTDLTRLGAGKLGRIDLDNGRSLGAPSAPVSG